MTTPVTAPSDGALAGRTSVEQRLAALETQLSQINGHLEMLVSAQRPMLDLRRELEPISREVMDASINQLAHLEQRGYFDFARELVYLVDRIVEDYSPEDLHQLADHAANILDTVRLLTQPSVMSVAREVAQVFEEERHPKPRGLFGAWRRIRREKNLQRGIGFSLDLLGRLGRAVSRAPRFSRASGGSRPQPALLSPPPRSSTSAVGAVLESQASAGTSAVDPFALVPDDVWSRQYASEVAAEIGVPELSEAHWQLVQFARDDYHETGAAPNIRRITSKTGVSTSQVYELFPRAPGLTLSRLAGIPKPAGCL